MYFPVMRGKQFELIALQELASIVSPQNFKPIIEPVRSNLTSLIKTIHTLNIHSITPLVIINPCMGDFVNNNSNIINELLNNPLELNIAFIPCIKVNGPAENFRNIIRQIEILGFKEKAIYIYDDLDRDKLDLLSNIDYVIINKNTPDMIIKQLKKVVLIDDPFQKKNKNADYTDKSFFSDLHISFNKLNFNIVGFGDYTIVGDNYSERGGPAYVVTIHLSYIDKEYNSMHVRHFSSEDDKTPTNPAGKFFQALEKCIRLYYSSENPFIETSGIFELESLFIYPHFPGLGVIKKISIKHHIETICEYLERAPW